MTVIPTGLQHQKKLSVLIPMDLTWRNPWVSHQLLTCLSFCELILIQISVILSVRFVTLLTTQSSLMLLLLWRLVWDNWPEPLTKEITGTHIGKQAKLPRIDCYFKSKELQFMLIRRQCQILIAFALMKKRSEGHSLSYMPCLSCGRLHVALSLCSSFDKIKFYNWARLQLNDLI